MSSPASLPPSRSLSPSPSPPSSLLQLTLPWPTAIAGHQIRKPLTNQLKGTNPLKGLQSEVTRLQLENQKLNHRATEAQEKLQSCQRRLNEMSAQLISLKQLNQSSTQIEQFEKKAKNDDNSVLLASSLSSSSTSSVKRQSVPLFNLAIFREKLGNEWLKEQYAQNKYGAHIFENEDDHWLTLINRAWENYNYIPYSELFLKRKIGQEEVSVLSMDVIKALHISEFLSIVDLLSPSQAWRYINDPSNPFKNKICVFLFNQNFAEKFADSIEKKFELPIEESTIERAGEFLEKLQKYDPESFKKEINPETLNRIRLRDPYVDLKNLSPKEAVNLKLINKINLSCIMNKIDFDFLSEINLHLSSINPTLPYSKPSLRANNTIPSEFSSIKLFYPASKQSFKMINRFIYWFNDQLTKCDKGEENPIIFAAQTIFRLTSIQVFSDGNWRTARVLVDLILRRYELLPAAWGDTKQIEISLLLQQQKNEQSNPTKVVKELMRALSQSYAIVQESQQRENEKTIEKT